MVEHVVSPWSVLHSQQSKPTARHNDGEQMVEILSLTQLMLH
jgi:hypothetical protein